MNNTVVQTSPVPASVELPVAIPIMTHSVKIKIRTLIIFVCFID